MVVDEHELERRRYIFEYFCNQTGIDPFRMSEAERTLFELTLKFNAGELQPRKFDAIRYLAEQQNNPEEDNKH